MYRRNVGRGGGQLIRKIGRVVDSVSVSALRALLLKLRDVVVTSTRVLVWLLSVMALLVLTRIAVTGSGASAARFSVLVVVAPGILLVVELRLVLVGRRAMATRGMLLVRGRSGVAVVAAHILRWRSGSMALMMAVPWRRTTRVR